MDIKPTKLDTFSIIEGISYDPQMIDESGLSDDVKRKIVDNIIVLYDSLLEDNPNTTFEDVVNHFAELSSPKSAENAYDLLFKAYKEAKLPGYENMNWKGIYNKLFKVKDAANTLLNIIDNNPDIKSETELLQEENYNFDEYDIYLAENDIMPFDEDQYSDPEYYSRRMQKDNNAKDNIKLYHMKAWYNTSLFLMVLLFIGGIWGITKQTSFGFLPLISGALAFGGILMYHKNSFGIARIFLILAGILSVPIGILLVIAGIRIYTLSKNRNYETEIDSVEEASSDKSFPLITIFSVIFFSFIITTTIYQGWTLIIAFKQSMLAGFLTVIFPVISNLYWLIKMSDNSLYVRFAIATIILSLVHYAIQKTFSN